MDVEPAGVLRLGTREGRWVIVAMVLGSAVTFLSATVVNVALPAIQEDLDADLAGLQWVTNGYLVTLSALLLTGGSAGDTYGRRRIFLGGMGIFLVGAVVCTAAPTLQVLIGGRLLQGVGAALMTPASLAIIDASFHPDDQSRAIASWASGSALASSLGPFVGGFLVDEVSWRWIFLIIVPFAAVSVWATTRHVPETRDARRTRRLDLIGSTLAVVAVGGVVYALVQGPVVGWSDPVVLAAGAAGVAGGIAFVSSQRRERDPMLPLRLFASRQFSGANVFTLVVYFAIGGAFFFTALQFQTGLGYSALAAGAALVPMNIVMVIGSPRAGELAGRIGPRALVTAGPLLVAGALVWMSRIGAGDRYAVDILPPVLLMGAGLATMVAPLTASVLGAVSHSDVGIASAVNNAVARTAGLLATAAVGAALAASYASGVERNLEGIALSPESAALVERAKDRALNVPDVGALPARDRPVVVEATQAAAIDAFHLGMLIAAALLAVGGLIGLLKIRNPEPGDVHCADCPGGQLTGAPLKVADVPRREPAPA